jgi:hypothetical protein
MGTGPAAFANWSKLTTNSKITAGMKVSKDLAGQFFIRIPTQEIAIAGQSMRSKINGGICPH